MASRASRAIGWTIVASIVALVFLSIVTHAFLAVPRNQGHGISMSHGENRSLGIGDDKDYDLNVPVSKRDDIVTWARARETGYRVAGSYGDVVTYWADGARELRNGTIVTDPDVATQEKYLAQPLRLSHRGIVWVDYNASTGNFDAPEMGLWNVTTIFFPEIDSWPRNHYDRAGNRIPQKLVTHNASLQLVYRSDNQTVYHAGQYSGLITKPDAYDGFDQDGVPSRAGHVFESHIVKLEWIEGKLAFLLDLEVVQVIDYATIVSLVVGATWFVRLKIRRET